MRKFLLALALTAACASPLLAQTNDNPADDAQANDPLTFNIATYNIAMKSLDPVGCRWDKDDRKSDVYRIIEDYDWDVFGLNECEFGYGQYNDIFTDLGATYGISGWDHRGVNDGNAPFNLSNLVLFKADKFDLLDEGFFFLNHEEENWTFPAWDYPRSTDVRTASWAKLQPKGTDKAFYFVSTHQTFNGVWGRALMLQTIIDRVWRIAGCAPVVFCGDMNHKPSRRDLYYTSVANFSDAYILNNKDCGLDYASTSSKWSDDVTSGGRIDYLFTRYMKVNSYRHIDEKYDRDMPPSDHYPVMANITLLYPETHTYCVDPQNGSDENSGLPTAPVATITKAISLAMGGDTIKLAAAEYNENSIQVDRNLKIIGGYNPEFTSVVGKSTISSIPEKRLINVNSTFGAEIRNIIFRGAGKTTGDTSDGGALYAKGYLVKCIDCEFYDNHTSRDGGAIWVQNQLILERCIFGGNSAGRNGGAVCTVADNNAHPFNQVIRGCYFYDNTAADGSALYLPKFRFGWVDGNTFTGNNATNGSTALCVSKVEGTTLETRLAVWNNTFTSNTATAASAMHIDIESGAPMVVINNTIVGNTSTGAGYAVDMLNDSPQVWSNIIALNQGGDFRVNTDGYSDAYNVVTSKTSCSPTAGTRDFFCETPELTAAALAEVLDGELTADGSFIPNLTLPTDLVTAAKAEFYVGTPGVNVAPYIAMKQPDFDGRSLRCIPSARLTEKNLRVDFDYDGELFDVMHTDVLGTERPTDGTATVGAVECATPSGLTTPSASASSINAADQLYDLQGRRLRTSASPGLYLLNGRLTHIR